MSRQTAHSGAATGFVREPSGSLVAMRTGGGSHYYLSDVQGSVIGLVDASGKRSATYAYGPYGEERTATGTAAGQPYRYTGTYLDPSGLYTMGARYYDPALGRFTQPDPSGREANPYAYASGDPVNRTDPMGTASFLGGVSTLLDVKSLGEGAQALSEGDWNEAAGVAAGWAAGAVTEATCGTAAVAAGLPTAGAGGFLVGAGCLAAGEFVGSQVEKAVSG
ncbi:RHS repeat-associated core domain-containing protein [Streptomyces sp. URMC 125]|uniref:RHS repeat-associated core domain-containing protein n=1 Tax=Streptomyces sp. URMC 125 TaxID=3423419 RepID=UPI003F1B7B88